MGPSAADVTSPLPAPARTGVVGRLLRAVPVVVVFSALAGTAYWGHATGWHFGRGKPGAGQSPGEASHGSRPLVRVEPAAGGTADVLHGRRVRIEFRSAADVEQAEIAITPVWHAAMTEQVTAGAEVGFDPSRLARLSARAGGVARLVRKAPGDRVLAGEVVALVEAAEVGKAKAEFQQALVQVRLRERTRDDLVRAKSATSAAQIREAEAALKDAEVRLLAAAQALANLGLPVQPADYRALTPAEAVRRMHLLGVEGVVADLGPATANLLPVRSPFAGVVLAVDAVGGEVVEAGKPLFVVADPRRVWVTLHIPAADAARVAPGQEALFRPDGVTDEFAGRVTWVGPSADETTRTVPVRAEFENDHGRLRASTLGRGRVILRRVPEALVVPHEAVREFRGTHVVFVRHPDFLKQGGPKEFSARVVRVGARDAQSTEILAGLQQGEVVATKGSSLLLDELAHAVER